MTYPGSLGLGSWLEDGAEVDGSDDGGEAEDAARRGLPHDVDACCELVRLSSALLSLQSSSALEGPALIPLSAAFCGASLSSPSAVLLSPGRSVSLATPNPPWARRKRSAANSRALMAACDWLGDEGTGGVLEGKSRLSGDPWGNDEESGDVEEREHEV